jgi:hypothetical protein
MFLLSNLLSFINLPNSDSKVLPLESVKPRTLVDSVNDCVMTQEVHDSRVNWLSLAHDKCLSVGHLVFRPELLQIHLEAVKCSSTKGHLDMNLRQVGA